MVDYGCGPIYVHAKPFHFHIYTRWLAEGMETGVANLVRWELAQDANVADAGGFARLRAGDYPQCDECQADVYDHLLALWALGERLECERLMNCALGSMSEEEAVDRGCSCAIADREERDVAEVFRSEAPVLVDLDQLCGVELPQGGRCTSSVGCGFHSRAEKRRVPGRSAPFDEMWDGYMVFQ